MTVGIVGLGIAGLRAAALLEAAGIQTRLFEARARPGGRLHTMNLGEGVLYEAGGEWIDADHFRVLRLLADFGLDPLPNQEWPGKVVHNGKKTTEAVLWSDALEDDLRVEAAAREIARDLEEPAWRNQARAALDKRTVAEFVADHTTSERGRWWVTANVRSDEGEDLEQIGLLGWLYGYRHYLGREGDVMSAFRVPGGFQSLCERILAQVKGQPEFNRILTRVRQSPTGVNLEFADGLESVDRALLTLPPRALEHVIFEPALTVPLRCAIEGVGMGRAVKISWQFKSDWWKAEGWGGRMFCDGPIQQTWDASLGDAPILSAYVCGEAAAGWADLGDPVRAGLYELSQIEPQAGESFVRGWFHNWVHDPFSRGGFSHAPPGFVFDHMEHVASPHARIHFAGEHTAAWSGFIEGALESAERAVAEILAVEGRIA
jgi:monoamine oxidase